MPHYNKPSRLGGLIIARKEGERVIINHGEIVMEVIEIKGKYVRMAFKADKEISIQREERITEDKK